MPLFQGLSAFPLTPADEAGRVDTSLLSRGIERLCAAEVSSIGLLGSTGTYAYLSRAERARAVAAAIEASAGRIPVMVGVGALRTDHAQDLARDAHAAGADALLLAPVSYTPLTQNEVFEHFRSVAAVSPLPICIYDNPGTTHFAFGRELLQRLGELETVRAVKLPQPSSGTIADDIADLRGRTSLSLGYSGDWGMADAMLAGADAFYSVLAGLCPAPVQALISAAIVGDTEEARRLDAELQPMWALFQALGSLRVMYVLHDMLGLGRVQPPRPLLPLEGPDLERARAVLERLVPKTV